MKICAVICEYNPMHAGHVHHLLETRRISGCDKIVLIMSGSFTQRGIPAVYDKWCRTEAALKNGADMVIELPTLYATASAERFAMGGVSIANALNAVSYLSFGSEITDISLIERLADMLCCETDIYRYELKSGLSDGLSFPAARASACERLIPHSADILSQPNSILAVEYIKALKRLESCIKPLAVSRMGSGEGEVSLEPAGAAPSALAVREALKNGGNICGILPDSIARCYCDRHPVFLEDMFTLIRYRLLCMSADELRLFPDVSEGLENAILRSAASATSTEDLIGGIKSKRYTRTRINRILARVILGVDNDTLSCCNAAGLYARVLGVREDGRELLSLLSASSNIPVLTRIAGIEHPSLKKDILASDIRSLFDGCSAGRDFTEKLIVI